MNLLTTYSLVEEVSGVLIDIFTDLVGGIISLVPTMFTALIFNPTTGLTDYAIWILVFGAGAIVLGLFKGFAHRV